FPSLSALAARDDKVAFSKLFSQAVRQILFFVVPISALILVLRAQIVRVILGAGEFGWEDTEMTLSVLGMLSISLFAQSLIPIFTRAFYAFHNTRTPFYIAFFAELVNISLVLILIGRYEVMGLAVAFSVASIINMSFLFLALRRRVGDLDDSGMIKFALKILIASLLAGTAAQLAKAAIGLQFSPDTFPEVFLWLVISTLLGVATFSFACVFLRIDEFYKLRDAITRKIFRARDQIKEDASEVSGL
ncbi:hypothetical protein EPO05_04985, partial [Patescibacteria group bacterium]